VDWRGKTVLADPGTFLYTSDIEARNRFRSTRAHSTVIIDDREQRVLTLEPFGLPGPMQAYPAEPVGEEGWAFTRPLGQGMTHRRELRLKGARISLRDTLAGSGRHRAQWRFQLHPHVAAHALPNGFALELPGTGSLKLETSNTSLQFEIETSEYSPGYGRTQQSHTCVAGIENNLPLTVDWQIQPGQ
jgi:uncharacterized heparinase superfamily protein